MGPKELRHVLLSLWIFLALLSPAICAGQAHFPYRARGGYYEGVRSEQPISGVNLQLLSVCAVVDDNAIVSSSADPEYLHLAFVMPETAEDVDITIRGPGNYVLDRVNSEFEPGLNVFAWRSNVVEGLGIDVEELEPLVSLVDGMNIPCLLHETEPAAMPQASTYRVLLQSSVEGSIHYFVRDAGRMVAESRIPVSANVPVEACLPATITSDHMDLTVVLEYEADGVGRTAARCFLIRRPESIIARTEGG